MTEPAQVVISRRLSGAGEARRTTRQPSILDRVAVWPRFSPRKGTSGKVEFDAIAVVQGEGRSPAGARIHDPTQDVVYVLEVTRRPYTAADRARATVKQAQVLNHLDQLTQWEGAPNPAAYVYTVMTDVPMDAALGAYLEQLRATIQRAAPGKTVIVVHRRIEP
ncbi:hypothetical protein [Micromonospora sp. NPDC005806]|uniref:hypothetical protein n=1 Tax=Micromonospora sp. NPDC005806 TaxID=3364234 RepID=UPI00369FD509